MNCTEELKRKIAEQNTTLEAVVHTLGVNRSTLYRKLRSGGNRLTVSEASKICKFLNLQPEESFDLFWGNVWH